MAFDIVLKPIVYWIQMKRQNGMRQKQKAQENELQKPYTEHLTRIAYNPENYLKITSVVRRCKIKTFPYIILFVING